MFLTPGKGSGYMFFMRDRAPLAQAFDADRLELTGEPVELADQLGSFLDQGPVASEAIEPE